jgi:hypothetical protein
MSYAKDREAHYEELSKAWENETAIKQVDQIVQVINICQAAPLMVLIFLPIPLITALRFLYLTSHNQMISKFKGTIVWEFWAVILSSFSYVISLKYLWPILTHLWNFFNQHIDLEELGQNLWQFATVQAAIVLVLHLGCTGFACRSFTILPLFQERYEQLKRMRFAFQENTQAEITLKARMIDRLPSIFEEAISTQTKTILTALVLNEEQAEKLEKTLQTSFKSIVGSVMSQIDPSQAPKTIEAQNEPEYDD